VTCRGRRAVAAAAGARLSVLGGGSQALAAPCESPASLPAPAAQRVESDQRYDDDSAFTSSAASGAYDYWAVATHESGHSIGPDHAAAGSYLTMYPEMTPGDVQGRTLARGDVIGLRTICPPVP
jgi:hypothetical protein